MLRYKKFLTEELSAEVPDSIRRVLTRVGILYGLWSLDAHTATLYEGGYFSGPEPNRLLKNAILKVCSELKPDAVALADAFAPPDFILNSVLGYSNGDIYRNIFDTITTNPESFERPTWWRMFTENKPNIAALAPLDNPRL